MIKFAIKKANSRFLLRKLMNQSSPACECHRTCTNKATDNDKERKNLAERILESEKLTVWMTLYENVVGLSEVRFAQDKVIKAEENFLKGQQERRLAQKELQNLQHKLRTIHSELDKISRGDERYLDLLTEEHKLLRMEASVAKNLEDVEQLERAHFASLSSAVRESHEKERQRTERTKYWSLIGSVAGVILGVIGSSLNNYLRMKEMRNIVLDQAKDNSELKSVIKEITDTISTERCELQKIVAYVKAGGDDKVKQMIEATSCNQVSKVSLEDSTQQLLNEMLQTNQQFVKDLSEVKKSLGNIYVQSSKDGENTATFVGLDEALQKAEENLEGRIKANAIWTVTMVYTAFALSIPIIFTFFKS